MTDPTDRRIAYKGRIDSPCSACGDGDTAMEYHDHERRRGERRKRQLRNWIGTTDDERRPDSDRRKAPHGRYVYVGPLSELYPAAPTPVQPLAPSCVPVQTAGARSLQFLQDAAGLCQSEANKWEHRDRRTFEHWDKVALLLRARFLVDSARVAAASVPVTEQEVEAWYRANYCGPDMPLDGKTDMTRREIIAAICEFSNCTAPAREGK